MCRMVSVVDGRDVPSAILTGVTSLVVSAEVVVSEVVVWVEAEVWRCKEVVEVVLGEPAAVVLLVVDGIVSTGMVFVVPVSAEVTVPGPLVQSETPVKVLEVVARVTVDD